MIQQAAATAQSSAALASTRTHLLPVCVKPSHRGSLDALGTLTPHLSYCREPKLLLSKRTRALVQRYTGLQACEGSTVIFHRDPCTCQAYMEYPSSV